MILATLKQKNQRLLSLDHVKGTIVLKLWLSVIMPIDKTHSFVIPGEVPESTKKIDSCIAFGELASSVRRNDSLLYIQVLLRTIILKINALILKLNNN